MNHCPLTGALFSGVHIHSPMTVFTLLYWNEQAMEWRQTMEFMSSFENAKRRRKELREETLDHVSFRITPVPIHQVPKALLPVLR